MNLNVLAKRLDVSKRDLFKLLDEHGVRVRRGTNKLSDRKAKEFIKKVEGQRDAKEEAIKRAEEERRKGLPSEITVPEVVKVKDLAKEMTLSINELIQSFINNGVMATLNDEVDFETVEIIADEFGMKVKKAEQTGEELAESQGVRKALEEELSKSDSKKLKERPPVVAVLGHVDHGKTSLLDAIRNTEVASGESGGITQHIGAYQIKHNGKRITFLDTPGHEAFSAMRERGARVTDVAILVVAADDGVQPQTIEAISFIKNAGVPIVVAINKIDVPGADPLRVKKELADHDVLTEEWGGKTINVEVSAKMGTNIDELLEMILLAAEVEELKADPNVPAVGTIIESHLDPGKGAVATVLVQNGTLHKSDPFVASGMMGSIRTLEDDLGHSLDHAKPATPVRITGLPQPPHVGDILQAFETKNEAKAKVSQLQKMGVSRGRAKSANEDEDTRKRLNIMVKADVQGSVEPIIEALSKIPTEEVSYEVVNTDVGIVTESDVLMAASTGAVLYAFNTQIPASVEKFADTEKVQAKEFKVIYELVEDVRATLEEMLDAETITKKTGELEVLAIFRVERGKKRAVIGGRVTEGTLTNGLKVKIMRGEGEEAEEIGEGEISNLQKNKINVKELGAGAEGGLQLKTDAKIEEGDKLSAWKEEKKERTLTLNA
ncbi:MAG: translation initiation factor IF-2 [Candidatus Andersenbacteria bacterium]|nr:translation initiation factor IF-2 [Candidatus Andersenbacteria bacterium]